MSLKKLYSIIELNSLKFNLFNQVRLPQLSPDVLENRVKMHVACQNVACSKLIDEAKVFHSSPEIFVAISQLLR